MHAGDRLAAGERPASFTEAEVMAIPAGGSSFTLADNAVHGRKRPIELRWHTGRPGEGAIYRWWTDRYWRDDVWPGWRSAFAAEWSGAAPHEVLEAVPVHVLERRCRSCGCTDSAACVREAEAGETPQLTFRGGGYVTCGWASPDLCTACLQDGRVWFQPDKAGQPVDRRCGARG